MTKPSPGQRADSGYPILRRPDKRPKSTQAAARCTLVRRRSVAAYSPRPSDRSPASGSTSAATSADANSPAAQSKAAARSSPLPPPLPDLQRHGNPEQGPD